MVISEQRVRDLDSAIKMYLEGYQNGYFGVNDDFEEYAGFYHLTNEPVSQMFKEINLNKVQNALSVLASGDQIFHMINAGVQNIDTFDINRLTEYYALGFKRRAIECLKYEDFIKLFEYYRDCDYRKHFYENQELEKYVIENCDEEYKWFWQEFLYALKHKGFEASVFHLAKEAEYIDKGNIKNNLYMIDKSEFYNLQRKLKEANISYNTCSVMDVPQTFDNYDLVYLSNIMDYYRSFYGNYRNPKDKARGLIKDIYDKNLNKNGEIILTELMHTFYTIYFLEDMSVECIIDSGPFAAYGIKKNKVLKAKKGD